jgi:AraC-like DNA-binding protein
MKNCSLSLKTIPEVGGVGNTPFSDRNYSISYFSEFYSLHIYDYEATMKLGNEKYRILPGDITITPENTRSSYHLGKTGFHKFIHFKPSKERPFFNLPLHIRPNSNISDDINAKFADINRYKSILDKTDAFATAAGATLQGVLLLLSINNELMVSHKKRGSIKAVEKAADLIEDNIEERLSIPEICSKVQMSQNYLAKLFKEHFGVTMEGYLIRKRMELAKYFLQHTDMQIKEVGSRAGIPDPQYFNKTFKKHTGRTPSAVRKDR